MQEEIKTYIFDSREIRTVVIDSEPWFVGKDVAKVLGYVNPAVAVSKNVPNKYKGVSKMETPGGTQNLTVISEAGLYKLVFKSHASNAEKFTDWIAEEVLPSIRKHGAYMTPDKIDEILSNPDTIIQLATQLKQEREKVKKEREGRLIAEQRVSEYEPKASYYDLILQNKSLMNITQIAKDYGMSGAEMNKKLHELGVQFKQGGNWLLYAKYQKNGWTQSTTELVNHGKKVVLHTKWTQKGRIGIYQILKENDILPLIERDE